MTQENQPTVTLFKPSIVKVSMSYKVNMGNYESLGLEFGAEVSAFEGETTRAALNRVIDLISDELFTKVREVKAEL